MKKYTIGFLFILVFMFLGTNQSFACSCVYSPEIELDLKQSTSVFIGKVNTIKETNFTDSLMGGIKKNIVTFDVLDNIKGESSNKITISTPKDSATCGYNFEVEKEYIVYTYGEKNQEEVSLCSRTSETKDVQDDIEALKEIINNSDSNTNSGTVNEEVNTNNTDNGNFENTNTGEVDNNLENINTKNDGNDNENLNVENNKKINEAYVPILLIMISILIIVFGAKMLNKKR